MARATGVPRAADGRLAVELGADDHRVLSGILLRLVVATNRLDDTAD